jgi:hypothetical protein
VGTPPNRRNVVSRHANNVGNVLSTVGSTTRNRDQASHAHHNWVRFPETVGPSPQSNCSQSPGSGIHGRYTRRVPARHAFFASATARRVVGSEPG